jgi:hypothetical protein
MEGLNDQKSYCNNYRYGVDVNSHLASNNILNNNNNMISISTNVMKSVHPVQQPPLNNLSPNFAPNIRNNRLGQKYLANSNSNYYESFGIVNPLASSCNNSNSANQISPLIK